MFSPDCVFDASLVAETYPHRFVDLKGLINKFMERSWAGWRIAECQQGGESWAKQQFTKDRCGPLKAYLSVRNSPIRNDQAIEADLWRGELNSREAGTFRNAFKLCERDRKSTRLNSSH